MTVYVERLRRLAEVATPGPWGVEAFRHRVDIDAPDGSWLFRCGADADFSTDMAAREFVQTKADAEFIAATDPPTVLALLGALATAQTEVEAARADVEQLRAENAMLAQNRDDFQSDFERAALARPESVDLMTKLRASVDTATVERLGSDNARLRAERDAALAELAALRARIEVVRRWAMTIHGGTKSPADVWPGLREPLGIVEPSTATT